MIQLLRQLRRFLCGPFAWVVASSLMTLWLVEQANSCKLHYATQQLWPRPATTSPIWLVHACQEQNALEQIRTTLESKVTIRTNQASMDAVLQELSIQLGVKINIDFANPLTAKMVKRSESKISIQFYGVPAAEVLESILRPWELTWEVNPQSINIVPTIQQNYGTMMFDLAWIVDGDQQLAEIIGALDYLLDIDGEFRYKTIGSGLICQASEPNLRKVGLTLAQISRIDPQNLRSLASEQEASNNTTTLGCYGGVFCK